MAAKQRTRKKQPVFTAKKVQEMLSKQRDTLNAAFNDARAAEFANDLVSSNRLAIDAKNTEVLPTKTKIEDGSVALAAYNAIHGEKKAAYGPVTRSFQDIATIASIGCKKDITAQDIATILIAVKYSRESNAHSRDNLLDLCGYADLKQQLIDANVK